MALLPMLVAAATLLPGCLWFTAGVATGVVIITSAEDDSSPSPPEVESVSLGGPFLELEGNPSDVAIGHFIQRPEDGDTSHLDVAVIAIDRFEVTFLTGDGRGNLAEAAAVNLSPDASIPLAMSAVPDEPTRSALVVATSTTLECLIVDPDTGSPRWSQSLELAFEPATRSLDVGDFDGDGLPDIAVSSRFRSTVEIFRGRRAPESTLRFVPWTQFAARAIRALTVANFDADRGGPLGLGRSDIVVLLSEEESPTLKLLRSVGDGSFEELASFRPPAAQAEVDAYLDGRDDSLFTTTFTLGDGAEIEDPYPDLILARRASIIRILVTPDPNDPEGGIVLGRHTQGTGPYTSYPADAAILRLPRASEPERPLWDIAGADAEFRGASLCYADPENGLEVASRRLYELPGIPQALDTGDLDEDGYEDVAAVSVNPALLAVLLTNSPGANVESEPFHYPAASQRGENPPAADVIDDLALGFAGEGGTEPFLAMITGGGQEIVVLFLDSVTGRPAGRAEEYFVPSGELDTLVAADIDLVAGDELIASSEAGRLHLFRNRDAGSPRFFHDGLLLDFVDGEVPGDLQELSPQPKKPLVARLHPERLPDVLIPIQTEGTADFVALLPAAGDPQREPEIQLYRTLDEPRRVTVANVNGDAALDLLVACEGQSNNGNKVHILFGNPAALSGDPRIFFDRKEDLYSPLARDGLEASGAVEYLTTDNDALGFENPMRVLVAANEEKVSVYYNRMQSPSDAPVIEGPCEVYAGEDPERLMLLDLYLDGESPLDLIIADEDGGKLIFLENRYPVPDTGCESIWEVREESFIEGSPEEFGVLYRDDPLRTLTLYVTTKTYPRLEVYERAGCPQECQLALLDPVLIGEANHRGRPRSFALYEELGGGHLAAMLVEDRDRATDRPRVDLQELPAAVAAEDIQRLGSLESPLGRCAVLYDQELLDDLDGVLLGRFLTDADAPGLLVHDGASGRVALHRGESPPFIADPENPELIHWVPVAAAGETVGTIEGPLLDWETVSTIDAGDLVLATTETETRLCEIRSGAFETIWSIEPSATVRSISHGWFTSGDRRFANLLIVQQEGQRLVVYVPNSPPEIQVASGVQGIARVSDINGDRLEDIVLADDRDSRLSVFLARKGRQFSGAIVTAFPLAVEVVDVEPLDANGDGYEDIAVGHITGEVVFFFGNGTGSFAESRTEFSSPDLEALGSADLDADGRDELMVAARIPGLVILTPEEKGADAGEGSR